MDKHKRKVDLDEDNEPKGRPWLSYLLFALAVLAILVLTLIGPVYQMIVLLQQPVMSDPRPWGPDAR